MKLTTLFLCLAVALPFAAGCSDAPDYGVEVKKVPAVNRVRSLLEGYAKRGQLDSSAHILEKEIKEMKKEGAANADELLADAKKLLSMKSPGAIRKQAQEMLAKLPEKGTAPATPPAE